MEMLKQEIKKAEFMLDEFESNKASKEAIRDIIYYIKGLKMAYKIINARTIYVY